MKNFLILFLSVLPIAVNATTFMVGPDKFYKKPAEVMNVVADGDTVLIDAGLYQDAGIWNKNNLVIKGVGGFAHMKATANLPQGKAIWIIQGNDNYIESIEFSDAKVIDKNGAGIRMEGTNLTVRHCCFHDCEDGILCGKNLNSTIIIEFTEFTNCGYGDGYSHNLYIGNIQKLIFRFNYTHHAKVGHCLKSRANENIICYNRIMDESDGNSSYLINLPNGGITFIFGNSIMQGPNAENSTMVDYGSEGYTNPVHKFVFCNNTMINERNPGTYVRVANGNVELFVIINNIFAGYSAYSSKAFPSIASDTSNNFRTDDIRSLHFADETNYDYHLSATSPVIDKCSIWGAPEYYELEYKHKCDSNLVEYDDLVDIGAYQFVKPTGIFERSSRKTELVSNGILDLHRYFDDDYISSVHIYSLAGNCVLEQDSPNINREINVSYLNVGVYLCSIRTDYKVNNLMLYISE